MSSRQTERSSTTTESRKQKRRKPVACAECRRLKLRCNHGIPCSSCVKKGCAALCPNEVQLSTGRENRNTPSNTDMERLNDRIGALSSRVRLLEDALAEAYSLLGCAPHPLLADEHTQVARPLERDATNGMPALPTAAAPWAGAAIAPWDLKGDHVFSAMSDATPASHWYLSAKDELRDSAPGSPFRDASLEPPKSVLSQSSVKSRLNVSYAAGALSSVAEDKL
ncbi:hypothetical protein BV25DRAFT_1912336 [Artomyces pyxidatus]|uniref:Uncharacterized protein n=1 Tax=Artomyces pyxidatus TaxID=48021 RepID=A0ACB8TEX4_9AGAM|nr:hypothetical protein BV25DRAFT_1912336 [Artomyces pyxidatus]